MSDEHPLPVPLDFTEEQEPPKIPFWQDARLFGRFGPSGRQVGILMILALVIALGVLGYYAYQNHRDFNTTATYIQQARKDRIQRTKEQQANNDRQAAANAQLAKVVDQLNAALAQEKASTRDAICFTVGLINNLPDPDANARELARQLSARYKCVGYRPGPGFSVAPVPAQSPSTTPTTPKETEASGQNAPRSSTTRAPASRPRSTPRAPSPPAKSTPRPPSTPVPSSSSGVGPVQVCVPLVGCTTLILPIS